ncbi:MAG TPA: hypothetical protein VHS99_09430 [Chloroflexota bacterium]|jgi:hypothetical protein|nr:hypothetical protein [Chloroflexota bacterium]
MTDVGPLTAQTEPQPANRVHPHPIRWDVERQLWVCSQGCGFTRPKREGEVVPSREEAQEEALRAGTGADFADLAGRTAGREAEPASGGQSSQAPAE